MKPATPAGGKPGGPAGGSGPGPQSPRRRDVVVSARRWLGTPYRHQASCRGAGCDCLGLLRGVWRDLYGAEPAPIPPYSPDWDEVAQREVLQGAARRHLVELGRAEPRPGDVILFRMRRDAVAKHLGIATGEARFIHAYSGHGVVECALTVPWRRRIAGLFAFPGLD